MMAVQYNELVASHPASHLAVVELHVCIENLPVLHPAALRRILSDRSLLMCLIEPQLVLACQLVALLLGLHHAEVQLVLSQEVAH